jgi:hypothetical protein
MSKSKFFTDCNNRVTFSLDTVVSIKKKNIYDGIEGIGELMMREIVITTLVGKKREKHFILFGPHHIKERDAEFKRLSEALSEINS